MCSIELVILVLRFLLSAFLWQLLDASASLELHLEQVHDILHLRSVLRDCIVCKTLVV